MNINAKKIITIIVIGVAALLAVVGGIVLFNRQKMEMPVENFVVENTINEVTSENVVEESIVEVVEENKITTPAKTTSVKPTKKEKIETTVISTESKEKAVVEGNKVTTMGEDTTKGENKVTVKKQDEEIEKAKKDENKTVTNIKENIVVVAPKEETKKQNNTTTKSTEKVEIPQNVVEVPAQKEKSQEPVKPTTKEEKTVNTTTDFEDANDDDLAAMLKNTK